MKAIVDNAVPPAAFADLEELFNESQPGQTMHRDKRFAAALAPVVAQVRKLVGAVELVAAYFVQTLPGDEGSMPHNDHGATAVLHLSDVQGGDFLFLNPFERVAFRRGRLVAWTAEHLHSHYPPIAGDRRTLVTRYDNV